MRRVAIPPTAAALLDGFFLAFSDNDGGVLAARICEGVVTGAALAARALAKLDPHTFQEWAVGRLGGQSRPKGADREIDGEIAYLKGRQRYGRGIVSVKAGQNVNPGMIRDLAGVVHREQADLGIFVCVNAPTREMKIEAQRSAPIYLPGGRRHQIQIVTAKELVEGPDVGLPTSLNIIAAAEHARTASRKRPPKAPTPEQLRREPPLPPMGISGGARKAEQPGLGIEEPSLVAPARGRRRKSG